MVHRGQTQIVQLINTQNMYIVLKPKTPKDPGKPNRPIPYTTEPPAADKPADAGTAVGVPTKPAESVWRKPQVWLGGALVLLLGYIIYINRKTG